LRHERGGGAQWGCSTVQRWGFRRVEQSPRCVVCGCWVRRCRETHSGWRTTWRAASQQRFPCLLACSSCVYRAGWAAAPLQTTRPSTRSTSSGRAWVPAGCSSSLGLCLLEWLLRPHCATTGSSARLWATLSPQGAGVWVTCRGRWPACRLCRVALASPRPRASFPVLCSLPSSLASASSAAC
jgi:hypothetical protein